MSTIIIRMKQQKMSELGEHLGEGLRHFGKAMTIFEDMKEMCEEGMQEDMGERRGGMNYRYPVDERMGMRSGGMNYREEDDGYERMGERRGRNSMGRYTSR